MTDEQLKLLVSAELIRRENSPKQSEIAEHLDMSERAVREFLVSAGIGHKQSTLSEIRIAYIRRQREVAAGRATAEDGIDLATERALLARSQREGQEIKNEVARGTYAPISLLADVLANASQAVVDRFDQIPAMIKRVCPDLPAPAFEALMGEVASARNEMVAKTASLVADTLDAGDIQDADETAEGDPA
jgi:phage terminase Nu1 subunit (DNA packaging protein)